MITNPDLFPLGLHLVSVSMVDKQISSKGNEYLTFSLVGAAGKGEGKTVRERCFFTPKTKFRYAEIKQCLGVDGLSDDASESLTVLIKAFAGKEMKVMVSKDSFVGRDGVEREARDISYYESLDPVVTQKVRATREARIKTAMRLKDNAGSANAHAAQAAAASNGKTNVDMDDNIPF